jgi:hypothetical protein
VVRVDARVTARRGVDLRIAQLLHFCVQVADDDSAVEGKQRAELIATFRCLFLDGGIWLHEAAGTLTHCVLAAIKDRAVFFGRAGEEKLIVMGWPAPESVSRAGPIGKAKRFFELVDAFMQSHFPGFETGQLYGAFDLSSKLPVLERCEALRRSESSCAVRGEFPGSLSSSGFFAVFRVVCACLHAHRLVSVLDRG